MLAKILLALYTVTSQNVKIIWTKKRKITKQSQAYKGYASSYNVNILNFFNPELELRNTESEIKNKLINLFSEKRGFKFVTALVIMRNYIMRVTLVRYSNQSILQLYQTSKNVLEKVRVGLLIQS